MLKSMPQAGRTVDQLSPVKWVVLEVETPIKLRAVEDLSRAENEGVCPQTISTLRQQGFQASNEHRSARTLLCEARPHVK